MPFDSLAEKLLKAGVAPRHVYRYIDELEDHLDELRTRLRRSGHSDNEAELLARTRLGDENELALAMLEQPGFRTWSARMPWLVFSVIPTVIALALFFIPLIVLKWISRIGGPIKIIDPSSLTAFAHYLMDARSMVIAPAISVLFALVVARQRLHVRWALLAAASVAVLDLQLAAQFPSAAHDGHLGLSAAPWMNQAEAKAWLLGATQAVLTLLPVTIPLARTVARSHGARA